MILAVLLRLVRKLSQFEALDAIEEEFCDLDDIGDFINISALISWERLLQAGYELFLSAGLKKLFITCQWEQLTPDESGLILFLEVFEEYTSWNTGAPIRDPGAFPLDLYLESGGSDQLIYFLFGTASQHR